MQVSLLLQNTSYIVKTFSLKISSQKKLYITVLNSNTILKYFLSAISASNI